MFTTYVLYSKSFDKIYIGFTSNIEIRLQFHNSSNNKGWTNRYQPWILLYKEVFDLKQNAMFREKQLKTARGRKFIRSMIK